MVVVVDFESISPSVDSPQDLENLSMYEDETKHNEGSYDPETETAEESRTEIGNRFEEVTAVNCLEDVSSINFKELSLDDLWRYHFVDVGVAFMFYNWYASFHGFDGHKSKVVRNRNGELIQQTFVCYRQGISKEKSGPSTSRKRVPRARVRCGCEAKCRVHIDANSGRWYMKFFDDQHNHLMLDDQFMGMLPAHRKMTGFDIWRMSNMRQVGIKTSHIFGLFASEAGGFQRIGFRKRDMYNEQERQRLTSSVDAKDQK